MICFKGCKKEIDMLNELLSAQLRLNSDVRESAVGCHKKLDLEILAAKTRHNDYELKIEELTQANLRAATAFKNAQTEKLSLESKVKELESKILKCEEEKVSNKLKGTPELKWELPQKPKDYKAKWEGTRHTTTNLATPKELLGTSYNDACTGQPLYNEFPLPEGKPYTIITETGLVKEIGHEAKIVYNGPVTAAIVNKVTNDDWCPTSLVSSSTSKYPAKKRK